MEVVGRICDGGSHFGKLEVGKERVGNAFDTPTS